MQKLIYNRNKQVIVTNFSKNNQRWLCPNCLHHMKDDLCKEGYTATCSRCKKEFEIFAVREPKGSLEGIDFYY